MYARQQTTFLFHALTWTVGKANALMQNIQFSLKKTLGVGQSGELASEFTTAVTMLHVGKLVSRLGRAQTYLAAAYSNMVNMHNMISVSLSLGINRPI